MPKSKPSKPRKDYPLFAHNNGQWAKKIRGRLHYFGPWADPLEAERNWERDKLALLEGRDPKQATVGDSVGWLVNSFLHSKTLQKHRDELSERSYLDYKKVAKHLADYFGRGRKLDTLRSSDIEAYRNTLPANWSPSTTNHHLRAARAIFRYANAIEATERPIRYEIGMKQASRASVRKHAAKQPAKTFTREQITALIDEAGTPMKAFVLMGINAAYGTSDIARLTLADVQAGEWLSVARGKTGVSRSAWLWPETREAIDKALSKRFEPRNPEWEELAFLTRNRRPWAIDGGTSHPLQIGFSDLKEAAGIDAKGRGHYALRHTFATVAGDAGDQIAVNAVMGHADGSIVANYRHGIDPERVKHVCSFVRNWLFSL